MNVASSESEFRAISYSPYNSSSLEGERLLSVIEDQGTTRASSTVNYLVPLSYLIHHRVREVQESSSKDDLPS